VGTCEAVGMSERNPKLGTHTTRVSY
jgi:hypothetical protein